MCAPKQGDGQFSRGGPLATTPLQLCSDVLGEHQQHIPPALLQEQMPCQHANVQQVSGVVGRGRWLGGAGGWAGRAGGAGGGKEEQGAGKGAGLYHEPYRRSRFFFSMPMCSR